VVTANVAKLVSAADQAANALASPIRAFLPAQARGASRIGKILSVGMLF
jgi:hypothetical protein